MFENWVYQLVGSVPQAIAVVFLGTAIVKEKYQMFQMLTAGLFIGFTAFVIQQLPLKYGTHIPLNMIISIIILRLLLKMNLLKSALAVLISFLFLITIELLSVLILSKLIGYPFNSLDNITDNVKLLMGLPSLLLIILISSFFQLRLHYRTKKNV